MHHQLDQVLDVFARPRARSLIVLVLAANLAGTAFSLMQRAVGVVARSPDALQFLIAERHLVGALTGPDGRFDVGADRRFRHPLPVDGEAEEGAQGAQASALRPKTELQEAISGESTCLLMFCGGGEGGIQPSPPFPHRS